MEIAESKEAGAHETPFTGDAMDRLSEEGPLLDYVEQVEQEIEENLTDRTKTGRKSKKAKTAEEVRQFQQVTRTAAAGLNALIASRIPEFEYSSDELDVIGTLGGKILSKHVNSAMTEYGDEITLAVFVLSATSEKGMRYQQRVKAEGGTTWMSNLRQKINSTIKKGVTDDETGNDKNGSESNRGEGIDDTAGKNGAREALGNRAGSTR